MRARAYVLLDVRNGKSEEVTRVLRTMPGVVMADILEGPPDVIVVVEACEQKKLAERTITALASVETMTDGVRLLPAQEASRCSHC